MPNRTQPSPQLPADERVVAAWREAITAYRASIRAGDRTTVTRQKAVVALMQVAHGLSQEEAAVELTPIGFGGEGSEPSLRHLVAQRLF